MAYRLAKSLVTLRDQVSAAAPNRSTASDGWIGDARHRGRGSDHNPNSAGVVTALDITHDPAHGVDGNELAESAKLDPRVKYVIWNKKIWNASIAKAWRAYKGSNPHTKHVHISTLPTKAKYDDAAAWVMAGVEEAGKAAADLPPAAETPTLRLGSQGLWVRKLQTILNDNGAKLKVDGDFGPKTQAAVKNFQNAHGLTKDGIVGPYTWDALGLEEAKQADAEIKASLPPLEPPVEAPGQVPVAPGATPPSPSPDAPSPASEVPPSTPTEPVEGSNAWTVGKFVSLGWPVVVAMALTAHLIWESGNKDGKITWGARGDRSKDGVYHSHTAAQLNDKHGRWQSYEQFAKDKGLAWDSPTAIVEWMNKEMSTTEKNVGGRLQQAANKSLPDAMQIAVDYWRPGKPHMDRRLKVAEKLEQELSA